MHQAPAGAFRRICENIYWEAGPEVVEVRVTLCSRLAVWLVVSLAAEFLGDLGRPINGAGRSKSAILILLCAGSLSVVLRSFANLSEVSTRGSCCICSMAVRDKLTVLERQTELTIGFSDEGLP